MSRSQFQSKRFILRHAWLNLWDERMTTGRINQVAIIFETLAFQVLWKPWQSSFLKTKAHQNALVTWLGHQNCTTRAQLRPPSCVFEAHANIPRPYLQSEGKKSVLTDSLLCTKQAKMHSQNTKCTLKCSLHPVPAQIFWKYHYAQAKW